MIHAAKAAVRSQLLAARRAVPDHLRQKESQQLSAYLADAVGAARIVAAYVPIGAEPGSPALPDAVAQLCETVLLPVARTGPDGEHLPLQWGRYAAGRLVAGRFGLREPAEPWLPASALSDAQVVLVPALAVDRRGVRLGRGGGFYDRSLPLCGPGARLVAVVRDCEVLDRLDAEPHDVPMTHALTPGRGLVPLSGGPAADGGLST